MRPTRSRYLPAAALAAATAITLTVTAGPAAGGVPDGPAPAAAAPVRGSAGPHATAGTVLATSPMPPGLWPDGTADALRVLYTTTGPHGPTPVSGALYLPEGPPPPGGYPVVAWAHGTVGAADSDAPSRAGIIDEMKPYVSGWLQRGYAVAATDYIGLGTPGVPPYLDGDAAAHAVVDSVRAAREAATGISDAWVVVGLSEGGQAAMFTASLADEYAPELDFRGTVAVGVPSGIGTLAPLAGPWFPPEGLFTGLTGYTAYILAGLRDVRPDLDIDSYLTPLGRTLVDDVADTPREQFKARHEGVSVAQMLSRSLSDPSLSGALREYLAIPSQGYGEPILLVQGAADTVVPLPLTLALVADLNLHGVHPEFRIVPGGHIQSMYQSEEQAAAFVSGLFD